MLFGVLLKAVESIVFGGSSVSARARAKLLTSTAQLATKTSASIEASFVRDWGGCDNMG
jgi:hypothetical protein